MWKLENMEMWKLKKKLCEAIIFKFSNFSIFTFKKNLPPKQKGFFNKYAI